VRRTKSMSPSLIDDNRPSWFSDDRNVIYTGKPIN
jgi:hypothetical protein